MSHRQSLDLYFHLAEPEKFTKKFIFKSDQSYLFPLFLPLSMVGMLIQQLQVQVIQAKHKQQFVLSSNYPLATQ